MSKHSVKMDRLNIWHVLGLAVILPALPTIMGVCFTRAASIFYKPDSGSFIAPARERIVRHRSFSNGVAELIRTPGYPLLVTGGLLMGRLKLATIALQILLSYVTVFMSYRTAPLPFEREGTAIIAAVFTR